MACEFRSGENGEHCGNPTVILCKWCDREICDLHLHPASDATCYTCGK